MLKSMTAYGRAIIVSPLGRFVVEIQSLNRKFMEVYVQLPTELSSFETEVRKWVSSRVYRGKVSVKITARFEDHIPLSVTPNIPLARQVKAAWGKIAEELQLEAERGFTLQMLGNEPGILSHHEEFEDEDSYRNILYRVTTEALD
ncbi:MAG: YicC/YloC family endoribonuclease, partial [Waddliaceae bacterium]